VKIQSIWLKQGPDRLLAAADAGAAVSKL